LTGHDLSGSILAGGSLATLVGLFIYGRKGDNEYESNETTGMPKSPQGMKGEDENNVEGAAKSPK
jgi:hypothetical protein